MLKNFNLIRKNKNLFNNDNSDSNKIILIEYNNFNGSHLCQALLANFFKKKNPSKIVAYFNYSLIVSPLKINFFQKLKWKISILLNWGHKKIYKSFGVEEFLRPEISDEITFRATKISKKFFSKKVKNKDIVNLKINNIWIGDLMYDTYLKSRYVPTFNPNSKNFKFFFKEFLELFFFWKNYFKNHKVVKTIGVHSCYSYGIPLRLSAYQEIPTFVVNMRAVTKINKKVLSMYGDFKFHKKRFKKLNIQIQNQALKLAKTKLINRFKGAIGIEAQLFNRSKSSFSKIVDKSKRIISRNSKIKILICTHDFMDSIHVMGKNFFSDFYEWIYFLGELSNNKCKEYDFYIKNHPNFGNKFERYQKYTDNLVKEFCKKYKNIKQISSSTSHHKIISEGIDIVLTVYGSVGIEYAYFGIPVINASRNNPHVNYKFNINPKNRDDYEKILNNLKKIKLNINKKEIYECYFMKHFYYDENWLFDDFEVFLKKIGGFQNIHTDKFYDYWEKHIDKSYIDKIYNRFNNFENSLQCKLNIFDSNKENKIFIL